MFRFDDEDGDDDVDADGNDGRRWSMMMGD